MVKEEGGRGSLSMCLTLKMRRNENVEMGKLHNRVLQETGECGDAREKHEVSNRAETEIRCFYTFKMFYLV